MVATAGIRASNARVTALGATSNQVRTAQAFVRVIYNHPTAAIRASNFRVVALGATLNVVRASSAYLTVIVRGRVAHPEVRAWTFTLDGHDFYVLRLGDTETLVYDTYSEQWVDWDGHGLPFWRTSLGMSWLGGRRNASTYGSDVIAGDDTWGLLWFLDPEQGYDDEPDAALPIQQIPFERVISAQMVVSGREAVPCNALFLSGDNFGLTADDFTPSITLEISDDQGQNYDAFDTLFIEPDLTVSNPYQWLSLGQIEQPGRIFRFTDTGVFKRIDSLKMNDDEDEK
jgi:hypothetical protein